MSDNEPGAYQPHSDPHRAGPDRADPGTGPSASFQADAMGSTIIAYLITGPALFGGLGWLLSQWLGLTLFIPVGILLGMSLSMYVIWLRYGRT